MKIAVVILLAGFTMQAFLAPSKAMETSISGTPVFGTVVAMTSYASVVDAAKKARERLPWQWYYYRWYWTV